MRTANGLRANSFYSFECFLSLREEPKDEGFEYLYNNYPHPKNICQSSYLIDASDALLHSSNLVFFPENILASNIPSKQKYAVFYFNKFYKIFHHLTIPLCSKLGLQNQYQKSKILDQNEVYKARCVWGYLHDYYHHLGPRPFDEQIEIKTKWFTGLLEEVKVDMQTYLTCITDKSIPFSAEVSEFILLERLFRYPSEKIWSNSFDAGTGLFLQAYLFKEGVLKIENQQRFIIEKENIKKVLKKLISEIEEIERFADEDYIKYSKEYIYSYLEKKEGSYFNFPNFLKNTVFERLIGSSKTLFFYPEKKPNKEMMADVLM